MLLEVKLAIQRVITRFLNRMVSRAAGSAEPSPSSPQSPTLHPRTARSPRRGFAPVPGQSDGPLRSSRMSAHPSDAAPGLHARRLTRAWLALNMLVLFTGNLAALLSLAVLARALPRTGTDPSGALRSVGYARAVTAIGQVAIFVACVVLAHRIFSGAVTQ